MHDGLIIWSGSGIAPHPWVNQLIDILHFFAVDCGDLLDPENGEVTISTTAEGGIASYSCDENGGYVLVGEMTRLCQADGMWSDQAPICARKKRKSHKGWLLSRILFIIAEFGLEFERTSYENWEDIGLDNFVIRVCFRLSNFMPERNSLTLFTVSGTAQGIMP